MSNINKVFEKAKKNTPCIVFIDEIDSIGKIRSDNNVESLNNLLAELDGFESRKGVTVIAATNHLGVLDRALIRGGRLSIHIKIPTLDTDTRKKIINEYFQKKELQNIFIDTILRNTNENFSPANLISLLKEIEDCGSKVLNNTKIAVIYRSFKKTHNIKKVSNKQTNGKIENSIGESQQYTSRPSHKLNDALCDSGYTSMFYPDQ
ncbi:AAA family ATPase [Wolbachia endosymbiont (group A) of Oxytorus armatus]|uniref:AAA family ATPase n=1 Tax=Wolbachia endosymbiont (group A) of Oxytorus armatus TaxID=3066211 RepID=UPI003132ADC1